jgi:membrane fusion protein (multidrug efflux system)
MSTTTLNEDIGLSDKKTHPIPATAAPPPQKNIRSLLQRYRQPALIVGGIIAACFVLFYAYDSFTHEETDDAYVTGHLHNISARLNEVVTEVLVNDNQFVHKGDILVKLDPSQYLAYAAAAEANLKKSQANLDRQEPLVALHAISPEDVDATRSSRDVNLAELKLAQLQIDYTTLKAPTDGYVGRKSVEVGNRLSSGQTVMVVVEPELWVVANFKETQLPELKKGQPAKITIDSIPDKIFDGVVDSFSPATGNQFALLPADNSTGNFTKIVQRLPVKIVFNPDSIRGYETRIRAGLSAVVKVALITPAGDTAATASNR